MPGFVYILQDRDGRYYIGSTDNPGRRMYQHGLGHTKTTTRMVELRRVLLQEFNTLKEARAMELRLKNFKRRDVIEKMVRDGHIRTGD